MLKKSLRFLQNTSFIKPFFAVQKLFTYRQTKKNTLYSLTNNLIFRHACATPLTVMMCNLEDAMMKESNQEQHMRIKQAFSATKRLSEIISSVTSLNSQYESFFVKSAIDEIVSLFNQDRINNIVCSNSLDQKIKIFGIKLYFQEALLCLLKNSLEAYDKNDIKPVTVVVRISGDEIVINLVDYACGMSLVTKNLALQEGVSYKENGTGLGLYFTKKTIEDMFDGQFIITSQVGLGTHVCIKIPANRKLCNQNLLQS